MKKTTFLSIVLLTATMKILAQREDLVKPDTIIVKCDSIDLYALVWRPTGTGNFPAIFFNHGRSITSEQRKNKTSQAAILGRLFAERGYIFFAFFRRGEGLSLDKGIHIGQLLDLESAANGIESANRLQLQLLVTRELDDALRAFSFFKSIPGVDPGRTGVVGHSFGGSLSLLVGARDTSIKAIVNFAGAAGSWTNPSLQDTLIASVHRLTSPVLFLYAQNDYSVEPGRVLDAELERLGKVHQLQIFPSFGKTAAEGHNFIHLAFDKWESVVFRFLDQHITYK